MFRMLAEMLGGGHEALPGRRRASPTVTFDAAADAFVADDGDERVERTWLGRGDLPGQPRVAPRATSKGVSIVEEMQRLAAEQAASGTADGRDADVGVVARPVTR